jgi:hypothetical protein
MYGNLVLLYDPLTSSSGGFHLGRKYSYLMEHRGGKLNDFFVSPLGEGK